jgi:hypothetical protein
MYNTNYTNKLFDFIVAATLSQGGDGATLVVHKHYRELSDLFEMYERARANHFTREIEEGCFARSFINNQESISFHKIKPAETSFYEVIVEI